MNLTQLCEGKIGLQHCNNIYLFVVFGGGTQTYNSEQQTINCYVLQWRLPIEERACRKTDLGGGDYYLRNSGLPPSWGGVSNL